MFAFPGELPKQLPVSLEVLQVSGPGEEHWHKLTGGIPPELSAQKTNLKQLGMYNCGLDGKLLDIRAP